MIYLDRKYLLLVSGRLDKFKTKSADVYNFRCNYCGDSKKNLNKARAYVFRKDNDYFFRCHNCQQSTTFSKFLEHTDPQAHKQYVLEKFSEKDNNKKPEAPVVLSGPTPTERYKTLADVSLFSLAELPDDHYAKEYVIARKIPKEWHKEIFYAPKYRTFLDETFPGHDKEGVTDDARLVMFFTNFDGTITNVSGRSLEFSNKMRYMTVKILDERKVFGAHRLRKDQKVYVLEGQFDSMFLPNAAACGDSNLPGMVSFLKENGFEDVVLVFDNQPRNKDICKIINKAVENNYNVVLLPYDPDSKDLNEMVMNGMSTSELKSLIDKHTYSGLTAKMKFIEWRK